MAFQAFGNNALYKKETKRPCAIGRLERKEYQTACREGTEIQIVGRHLVRLGRQEEKAEK